MISLDKLLVPPKTIVIIGLSDNPNRPSYEVAKYLQDQGFDIIPVNPNITTVLGQSSYKTFADIPQNIHIDIVDIFRQSDVVFSVVEEIISSNRHPVIWFQEGINAPEAEKLATDKGFQVISGLCLMKTHARKVAK